MQQIITRVWVAGACAIALALAGCGGSTSSTNSAPNSFKATNLVSDTAGGGAHVDANLLNAWGIAFSPTGPFWVSDNHSGKATVYDSTGTAQALVVTIPAAGGGAGGPVTGQVFNNTTGFVIPGTGNPAKFIFCAEDGLISAWNTGTTATSVADLSASNANFKGLAIASVGASSFLYAADFRGGFVQVFDSSFNPTSQFTDPGIPAGFAPFNVANIGGELYVTFAMQGPGADDDLPGVGNGYVDVFTPNGTLIKRLVTQGLLDSPWGIVQAPAGFGPFGNAILVGNFGNGQINAYDFNSGALLGTFKDSTGAPLVIDGLWALTFGNGAGAGSTDTLYFSAGPGGEAHGLFGSVSPQ